ncbi:MAG: hypothetical protein ACSHYA_14315 [Opitutaceae bacterium]
MEILHRSILILSLVLFCGCKTTKTVNDGSMGVLNLDHFIDYQKRALRIGNYVYPMPFETDVKKESDAERFIKSELIESRVPFIHISSFDGEGVDSDFPVIICQSIPVEIEDELDGYFNLYKINNRYLWSDIMRRTDELLDEEIITFFTFRTPQPPTYLMTYFNGKSIFRGIFKTPWEVFDKENPGNTNISNPNVEDFGNEIGDSITLKDYYSIYSKAIEYNEWIIAIGDAISPERFYLYDAVLNSLESNRGRD